jgi:hypothetical protein
MKRPFPWAEREDETLGDMPIKRARRDQRMADVALSFAFYGGLYLNRPRQDEEEMFR